jgi:hypothetical protein
MMFPDRALGNRGLLAMARLETSVQSFQCPQGRRLIIRYLVSVERLRGSNEHNALRTVTGGLPTPPLNRSDRHNPTWDERASWVGSQQLSMTLSAPSLSDLSF